MDGRLGENISGLMWLPDGKRIRYRNNMWGENSWEVWKHSTRDSERSVQSRMWVLSCFSCIQIFVTRWTVACQAPLSMGFSRQEYWSGLPFPSPGDLPNPGIEPGFPALRADFKLSEPPGKPWYVLESLQNHHPLLPQLWCMEKMPSTNLVPGGKNVGDHWVTSKIEEEKEWEKKFFWSIRSWEKEAMKHRTGTSTHTNTNWKKEV